MKEKILLAAIATILVSCRCANLDCTPPYDTFVFTYVTQNNEDLLSGPAKKYDLEDIKVYSFDANNDKKFANLNLESTSNPYGVRVFVMQYMERSFLEINNKVTDTLDLKFSLRNSECCGIIPTITQIKLNGVLQNKDSQITIVERN